MGMEDLIWWPVLLMHLVVGSREDLWLHFIPTSTGAIKVIFTEQIAISMFYVSAMCILIDAFISLQILHYVKHEQSTNCPRLLEGLLCTVVSNPLKAKEEHKIVLCIILTGYLLTC